MQNRVSLGGGLTASLWTTLLAGGLMAVSCSWITLTSISAQAADPNNILLDFSAKWCGPCQQMSPIVSKLERQGFPIRQVDVDQEKDLTQKYNVESIPCFVLIANGREINRITGATDEKQLRRLMMMLPKQNLDEAIAGPSPDKKKRSNADAQASTKSAEEKKGFPTILPLFPKKKKEAQQPADDESEIFRGQDPGSQQKSNDFARDAMTASTRIRVKDGSHVHFGSGTIIGNHANRAVILTCGHILRNLGKNAVIEVDLFTEGNSNPQMTIAQIMKYDLDADVGLLSVSCQQPLPVVRLAAARELPKVKDRVFSIGCGGGKLPSIEEHVVTAINGFEGPDNLECTGVPLQGRSGGGLFLGNEQVGVCILADANYKRGIYTGMKPVLQLLQKAGLAHLIPSASGNDAATESMAAAGEPATSDSVDAANEGVAPSDIEGMNGMLAGAGQDGTSGASLNSREYEGAEIVCTIHPKTPGGITRVVIINQASSRILNDLLHESGGGIRTEPNTTVQNGSAKKPKGDRSNPKPTIPATRMAMQKPSTGNATTPARERTIETSFDAERYSRTRE